MASFRGNNNIVLQPFDDNIAYTFNFPTCTSATSNDGAIAYSTTISGATTSATNSAGATITSLIDATNLSGENVVLNLTYPSEGTDRYKITFILSISDGSIKEFDFSKVYAKEI